MKKERLVESPTGRWTRVDDYVAALAQRRTARRHRRQMRARTEPETPRLLLSTIPFLALMVLLAVLAVGIMVVAFPGSQPPPRPQQVAAREQGVAGKGWFQEAQREMKR